MTKQEYISAAENRRKKRERELLLLLLLLTDRAVRESISAYKHGLDWRIVIYNRLIGRIESGIAGGVFGTAEMMQSAYSSGYKLAAEIGTNVPLAQVSTPVDYYRRAEDFILAMAKAITGSIAGVIALGLSVRETVLRIRAELKIIGYLKRNPFAIETGVERNIVSAFNDGILGYVLSDRRLQGFQHVSVIDEKTTKYCRPRDGTRLPITHPYWLNNWPSLHYRCRSLIMPVSGVNWTGVPDAPAPMAGFGKMPPELALLISRSLAA